MDIEIGQSAPNQKSLIYALANNDFSLTSHLLTEIETASGNAQDTTARLDEVVDLLDRLVRAQFSETQRKELHSHAISTLCALVHASEPDSLRERAVPLLQYLIASLYMELPRLSGSIWLLWLANRSAAEQALREYGLSSHNPLVKLSSISELRKWVDAVKGRIAFRKFTPSVVRLLRDEDENVRRAAYTLLVHFFSGAKQLARDDLVDVMKKNLLNQSLIDKVVSAIERVTEESGESVDVPSRALEDTPRKVNRPGPTSGSTSRPTVVPEKFEYPEPIEGDGGDSALALACRNDPQYPMQNLPPKDVTSDEEFVNLISSSVACFEGKETEHNWSKRQTVVQMYRSMLRSKGHRPSPDAIKETFKILQRGINEALISMRTTLATDACQAVKDTAQLLSQFQGYFELFDPLIESLTKVASGVKKITAACAHITICAIIVESPYISNRQFSYILQESRAIKPHARTQAFYWLKIALISSPISLFVPKQAEVESVVVKAIADAAPTGRIQGRDLYYTLEKRWPELANKIAQRLSANALKSLNSNRPKGLTLPTPGPPRPNNVRSNAGPLQLSQQPQPQPRAAPSMPHQSPKSSSPVIPAFLPRMSSLSSGSMSSSSSSSSVRSQLRSPSPKNSPQHVQTQPRQHSLEAKMSPQLGGSRPHLKLVQNTQSGAPESPSPSPAMKRFESSIELLPRSSIRPSSSNILTALPQQQQPETSRPGSAFLRSTSAKHFAPTDILSQSIADMSMKDINCSSEDEQLEMDSDPTDTHSPDTHSNKGTRPAELETKLGSSTSPTTVKIDFYNLKNIQRLCHRDAVPVLRQLASADLDSAQLEEVLKAVKSSKADLATSSALSRIIQADVENVSLEQRESYLHLLRKLDYESELHSRAPRIRMPSSSYRRSTNSTPIKRVIYRDADSESAGNDSELSLDSSLSSVSSDSKSTSTPIRPPPQPQIPLTIAPPSTTPHAANASLKQAKFREADFIDPFPAAPSDCRIQISNMIECLKTNTCSVSMLASLTVLVAASSSGALPSSNSPLRTAVSVWKQHFTFDMQIRDSILPFLSQTPAQVSADQVVVGLVLLRTLLRCDAPHAAVYLEAPTCVKALCGIASNYGGSSLELDEHLLLDVLAVVLELNSQASVAGTLINLLKRNLVSTASVPQTARVFGYRAVTKTLRTCASRSLDQDDCRQLALMISSGLDSNDVRVRKEVYPLLMALHKYDPTFAGECAESMSSGQRKLYEYYLETNAY